MKSPIPLIPGGRIIPLIKLGCPALGDRMDISELRATLIQFLIDELDCLVMVLLGDS